MQNHVNKLIAKKSRIGVTKETSKSTTLTKEKTSNSVKHTSICVVDDTSLANDKSDDDSLIAELSERGMKRDWA